MTIFYDLMDFIKNGIYSDILSGLSLFELLNIVVINDITIAMILTTIIVISMIGLLIGALVNLIMIPYNLITKRGV